MTAKNMEPGAVATPTQPILTVHSVQPVWVAVPVPEEASRKVYVGQAAKVTLDALPGTTFAGKVIQVNPSADPLSRQFTVRVRLENEKQLVKPGMFARVLIETGRVRRAIVIPREAIRQDKRETVVMVVGKDRLVQRRPVTLGGSDARYTAVTQGLQPGEKVITLSAGPVSEGQKVKVGGDKPKKEQREGGW